ncbi:MAG: hypothetical protein AABX70_02755 [Nanoarchaeota archaeon]
MRVFLSLLCFVLLLPFSNAITLKYYYSHPKIPMAEKKIDYLPLHEQSTQFRPSPYIPRTTIDTQSDVFRLVQQRIQYPYQTIPLSEVKQVRDHYQTIYHPLQKRTLWLKNLTDLDVQKLLIRPDVRNALGLPALAPFKPTI